MHAHATTSCWKRIGHEGDKSCPNLPEHIHCRGCPVFTDAGLRLFDRPAPEDYTQEWTRSLAQAKTDAQAGTLCALVFSLGSERLALPPGAIRAVFSPRPVRPLPHRSDALFLGMTVLQGEMVPCINVPELLNIPEGTPAQARGQGFARLLLAERPDPKNPDRGPEQYAFSVDQALGLIRYPSLAVEPAPSTVLRSPASYTRGIVVQDGLRISLLDEDLFFSALRRALGVAG